MVKFVLELDIGSKEFTVSELREIEYLLEHTIEDNWNPDLPENLGMRRTAKVEKFWKQGCYLRVNTIF